MKLFQSIRTRILIIYFSLAAVNIAFFSSVIFENQIDLITDNMRYRVEKKVSSLLVSIKKNTGGTSERIIPGSEKERLLLKDIIDIVRPVLKKYIVYKESGEILYKSGEVISPPETLVTDGLRAVTEAGFSSSEYTIKIDEKNQVMNFFIPLSKYRISGHILFLSYEIHDIGRRLDELYSQAFLILIVTVLFHVVFAIVLFKTLVKPIRVLDEETMKFAAGELSARVQQERKDEFGSLARSFNTMANSIEEKVAELERKKKMIEEISLTDDLTGLYNRRLLFMRLDQEISRARRASQPLGLLITDIDHFKKINDTYGHQVGDLVLKAVSEVIRANCRPMDTPARYGGEEFIVIAPNCDIDGIKIMCERIRQSFEVKNIVTKDVTLNITVSIGATSMSSDYLSTAGTPEKAIISFADTALYRAKENGRNRIELG